MRIVAGILPSVLLYCEELRKSRMKIFILRRGQCRAMPFLFLAKPLSHPVLWSILSSSADLLVLIRTWWANFPQRQKHRHFGWLKNRTSEIVSPYENGPPSKKKTLKRNGGNPQCWIGKEEEGALKREGEKPGMVSYVCQSTDALCSFPSTLTYLASLWFGQ